MKLLAILAFAAAAFAQQAPSTLPKIKFTDTKLDNGLRVIVSEDHYAPVYASPSPNPSLQRSESASRISSMAADGSRRQHVTNAFATSSDMPGPTNRRLSVARKT